MTAVNLKEQLTNLIGLQALDTQIYSLRREKKTRPEEIKALGAAFEAKKQRLAVLEKDCLELQKQRKDKELDLASKEENIKKLQGQLYALRTNKEYQAMMQEIGGAKADASLIEDKILQLMEETEKLKVQLEQERQALKQEEAVFNAEKKKIEDRLKEIDERLSQLDAQRRQIIPQVDPKVFSQYERILVNRDGLAIVKTTGNSCQGCNMLLPAQVINLIKMYERIITCEVCNRMLYIDEAT